MTEVTFQVDALSAGLIRLANFDDENGKNGRVEYSFPAHIDSSLIGALQEALDESNKLLTSDK